MKTTATMRSLHFSQEEEVVYAVVTPHPPTLYGCVCTCMTVTQLVMSLPSQLVAPQETRLPYMHEDRSSIDTLLHAQRRYTFLTYISTNRYIKHTYMYANVYEMIYEAFSDSQIIMRYIHLCVRCVAWCCWQIDKKIERERRARKGEDLQRSEPPALQDTFAVALVPLPRHPSYLCMQQTNAQIEKETEEKRKIQRHTSPIRSLERRLGRYTEDISSANETEGEEDNRKEQHHL